MWAEKYDRGLVDIFDVQDEVTEAIVSALQPALRRAEAERARRQPPESLEAWALVNRAWLELQGDLGNRDKAAATRRAAERAIEMDPEYALAHAVRAFATSLMWQERSDAPEWREDALEGLRRALALQPDDPQLRQLQGAIMGNLAQSREAMAAYERSLELDPSNAQARAGLGIAMVFAQRAKEGLVHIDRARELSPRDPLLYNALAYRALACVVLERYEEAAADARSSIERTATRTAWLALAVALAALDRLEEAGLARAELERLESGTTVTLYEPYVRSLAPTPADADRLFDAMRRAGFPD